MNERNLHPSGTYIHGDSLELRWNADDDEHVKGAEVLVEVRPAWLRRFVRIALHVTEFTRPKATP